jgi:hypothetical protein
VPLVHMIWMYMKSICKKSTSESQLKISSDRFHDRFYGDRIKMYCFNPTVLDVFV